EHARQEERDDEHGLDDVRPDRVVREVDHHAPCPSTTVAGALGTAARAMRTRDPGPAASVPWTREPGEARGSQTTWSGIAVRATGSVMLPCSVVTVSRSPSRTGPPATPAAVPGDTRAT